MTSTVLFVLAVVTSLLMWALKLRSRQLSGDTSLLPYIGSFLLKTARVRSRATSTFLEKHHFTDWSDLQGHDLSDSPMAWGKFYGFIMIVALVTLLIPVTGLLTRNTDPSGPLLSTLGLLYLGVYVMCLTPAVLLAIIVIKFFTTFGFLTWDVRWMDVLRCASAWVGGCTVIGFSVGSLTLGWQIVQHAESRQPELTFSLGVLVQASVAGGLIGFLAGHFAAVVETCAKARNPLLRILVPAVVLWVSLDSMVSVGVHPQAAFDYLQHIATVETTLPASEDADAWATAPWQDWKFVLAATTAEGWNHGMSVRSFVLVSTVACVGMGIAAISRHVPKKSA